MATIPITATVDDIDRLTVHFETGRKDGALFWSWDHDGGSLQAPPDAAFRFPVPGDYTVKARALNGDEGTVDVTVPGAAAGGGGGAGPAPTACAPNTGVAGGGTPVTITGTGLTGVAAVRFNGRAGSNAVVVNDTTVTVTTPGGVEVGPADVVCVRGDNSAGVLIAGFTFT